MFEKEAEEIANKKLCATTMCYNHCNFNSPKHHRCGDWHKYYEVAKECMEFGFNKANEWHKVSDKLPEMNAFVYLWTNVDNYPMIACRRKKCDEIDWYWDCQGGYYITRLVSVDEGYLWKEIILPKLKEGE